ncbi:hypothetical protein BGP_4686 [Beggiatoa sp. PS]|nr:hypothetical protein BGP_4686 [Beggiatoa sp. PS]
MMKVECPYCKGKVKPNMAKIKSSLGGSAMIYAIIFVFGLGSFGLFGLISAAFSGSTLARILLQVKIQLMLKNRKSGGYFKCGDCGKDTPIEHVFNQLLADGEFHQIRFEHNVEKNDHKGMKIYSKFSVEHLKDVNCRAIVYFTEPSGDLIKDLNGLDWTVAKNFTPSSDNSIYNNFTLFVAYEKLPFSLVEHELKLHIKLYADSIDKPFAISKDYLFKMIQD